MFCPGTGDLCDSARLRFLTERKERVPTRREPRSRTSRKSFASGFGTTNGALTLGLKKTAPQVRRGKLFGGTTKHFEMSDKIIYTTVTSSDMAVKATPSSGFATASSAYN